MGALGARARTDERTEERTRGGFGGRRPTARNRERRRGDAPSPSRCEFARSRPPEAKLSLRARVRAGSSTTPTGGRTIGGRAVRHAKEPHTFVDVVLILAVFVDVLLVALEGHGSNRTRDDAPSPLLPTTAPSVRAREDPMSLKWASCTAPSTKSTGTAAARGAAAILHHRTLDDARARGAWRSPLNLMSRGRDATRGLGREGSRAAGEGAWAGAAADATGASARVRSAA